MKEDVKIITIGTLKGGVGKSTLAFNIAGELAKDKKVLIIDLDPQSNSTRNFGIEQSTLNTSTQNLLIDQKSPNLIIKKGLIDGLNIDILPAKINLTHTEMQLTSQAGRERILLRYFKDNYDFFNTYDYIFIDTNPSMSVINQNAFVVADSVVLITEASVNALSGAELFYELWDDITKNILMENNIKGLIINKFESKEKSTMEFIEYLNTQHGGILDLVFETKIPKAVAIKDSTELDNKPLVLSAEQRAKKIKTSLHDLVNELKQKEIL